MAVSTYEETLEAHYSQEDLGVNILRALEEAGKDVNALTVEDLAPIEEFHMGGRKRTLELARLAELSEGMQVVDVGCGIGGPARALAHYFGCDVVGVDLAESFCAAANLLTERTNLAHKVTIRHGSALELPLEDRSVDVVWMQHVGMNIKDKTELFQEFRRVLRPGGKMALYEVFAGPEPAEYFPVPWASGPELSHLVSPEEIRKPLERAGFRIQVWNDVTRAMTDWFRAAREKAMKDGPPPLSRGILMGPEFPIKAANVLRSLEEDRLRVVQAISTLEHGGM
jgi:ubiquinone/menaquinone biosynthesis C-methylase UbiE